MRVDMAPPESQFTARTDSKAALGINPRAKAQFWCGVYGAAEAAPLQSKSNPSDSPLVTRRLATGANELNVPRICPDFENRSAAIQLAFGCDCSGSPLSS